MDRDLSPSEPDSKLSATKQRILADAQTDFTHRFATVTDGREIENDIPFDIFLEGCAQRLRIQSSSLSGFKLSGNQRYFHEICNQLQLDGENAEACKRRLSNKVALARVVLGAWKESKLQVTRPKYVGKLVELIERSKVLEKF